MSRSREPVDLTVQLHGRTDFAIYVSDDGERDNAVWLPLSQIEGRDATFAPLGSIITISCPEWLAQREGLI